MDMCSAIPRSENPESLSPPIDFDDPALFRSFVSSTSKNATGTSPRTFVAGLQASYHSVSCSRPMTWKKSPVLKGSSCSCEGW